MLPRSFKFFTAPKECNSLKRLKSTSATKIISVLVVASAFMPLDSLATKATPQSEYDQAFIEYTAKPAYRNVISLAAWQFDTMITQYNQLTELGHQIIKEIDVITED